MRKPLTKPAHTTACNAPVSIRVSIPAAHGLCIWDNKMTKQLSITLVAIGVVMVGLLFAQTQLSSGGPHGWGAKLDGAVYLLFISALVSTSLLISSLRVRITRYGLVLALSSCIYLAWPGFIAYIFVTNQ